MSHPVYVCVNIYIWTISKCITTWFTSNTYVFFSRSIEVVLWIGVYFSVRYWNPQGLDTDLDDILHPEEKEEVPHESWPGESWSGVFSRCFFVPNMIGNVDKYLSKSLGWAKNGKKMWWKIEGAIIRTGFTGVCPIKSMKGDTGSDLEPGMMKCSWKYSEQRVLKGSLPVSQLLGVNQDWQFWVARWREIGRCVWLCIDRLDR